MPDISMCPGGACKLKEICYRFKATPSKYMQSYFMEPPFTVTERMSGQSTECQHFIDVIPNHVKIPDTIAKRAKRGKKK
jgi:hypothetical protein